MSDCKQCERLKAELAQAKAELALTIDPDKHSIVAGIQRLSALLHEAKAENARHVCYQCGGLCVPADLLAPMLELLSEMDQAGPFIIRRPSLLDKSRAELARLRALTGESPPKKSSCAPAPESV